VEQQRDDNDIRFGEQGARLTYGSYLRLPQLLDSQHLESDPPAHDELLFITIHQVYELWFQQLLHEAVSARDAMLGTDDQQSDRLWWARHLLTRMHVIERVLVQQIDVLETMTPQDFLEFRQRLAPASGFQSVQFRELEFLSGPRTRGT
jgi:tryptophan 2,3-dioxygenase